MIQIQNEQGVEKVSISGDLDFHSIGAVREEIGKLADRQPAKVLVDLKDLSYIDSSGLAAFVELFQKMKRHGGKMVICNLGVGVKSVFEIAKLDMIFKLAKDEKEALALL